jgi:hypothetical protein
MSLQRRSSLILTIRRFMGGALLLWPLFRLPEAVFLLLLCPALAKADPVLIDFDSPLPRGAFYQAQGVVFHTATATAGQLNGAINNVIVLQPSTAAVSFASGIHRLVFLPATVNSSTGFDNLQFEATSVPEPASLILLTVGVGGLLARKRVIGRVFGGGRSR